MTATRGPGFVTTPSSGVGKEIGPYDDPQAGSQDESSRHARAHARVVCNNAYGKGYLIDVQCGID